MSQDLNLLADVQLRLQALEEARRLRPMVAAAVSQLHQARSGITAAGMGTLQEQQYLREAAEASERMAGLQTALARAEQELRRTAYLLQILSE